jgi:hypothetical protein
MAAVIARAAAALALAFVLPGTVLLRQYAVRCSEELPAKARLSGTLSLWGDDARTFAQKAGAPLAPGPGGAPDHLEIPAQLALGAQYCVLELGPVDQPLGRLVNDGTGVRGEESGMASALAGAVALAGEACAPFLWRGEGGGDGLEAFLRGRGGNPREVSFTRFDGRVAYAIGGPADGSGTAALVISQEALRPLRLLVRGTVLDDIQYREYRAVGPHGLPGLISVARDGAPLAAFEVQLPSR